MFIPSLVSLISAVTPAPAPTGLPAPLPPFPFVLALATASTPAPFFTPAPSLADTLLSLFTPTGPYASPFLPFYPLFTATPTAAFTLTLFLAGTSAFCLVVTIILNYILLFVFTFTSRFLGASTAAPAFIIFTWTPAFFLLASAMTFAPTAALASGMRSRPGSQKVKE